jgi:hypothetical protein
MPVDTNGDVATDEDVVDVLPSLPLTTDEIVRQANAIGLVSIPPEVATAVGHLFLQNVLTQKATTDLKQQLQVAATDMGVMRSRLEAAGLMDESPVVGAEVAPPAPFPSESSAEAPDPAGDSDLGQAAPSPDAP